MRYRQTFGKFNSDMQSIGKIDPESDEEEKTNVVRTGSDNPKHAISVPAPQGFDSDRVNVFSLPETPWNGLTEESCVICLENFELDVMVKTLPCLHIFHSKCINSWAYSSNKCPIDMKPVFK